MGNTNTSELGSVKLPATAPHRVVAVGATYLDATETIGPDGKPMVAYVSRLGYRGETVELNEHQAARLIDLDAVKPADEPLSYDEMKVEDLTRLAESRGVDVQGSGADGAVLKEDLLNALVIYDQGAKTDSGIAVAASGPGGVTVSDAESQSGRRA